MKDYLKPEHVNLMENMERSSTSVAEETILGSQKAGQRSIKYSSPKKLKSPRHILNQHHIERATESFFDDYGMLKKRISKTLYYGGYLPSTPRPSFPLTVLAVNAFTSSVSSEKQTIEFLDLDIASEIGRNACVSPTTVMMALVYLNRLREGNPTYLKTVKPSELFVVSLLVASKFIQDDGEEYGCFLTDWGSSLGLNNENIRKLEIGFLAALGWNLNVKLDEFSKILNKVEASLGLGQSEQRGWMTVTELQALSSYFVSWTNTWPNFFAYSMQVVLLASVAYIAFLGSLIISAVTISGTVELTRNLIEAISTTEWNLQHNETTITFLESPHIENNYVFGSDIEVTENLVYLQKKYTELDSSKQKQNSSLSLQPRFLSKDPSLMKSLMMTLFMCHGRIWNSDFHCESIESCQKI